jgi:hypothetical protein
MQLLTDELRAKLVNNGAIPDDDHWPVVKFFNPTGAATWLISEAMPEEPDILFGLCDLGMGEPELGSVRLSELQAVKVAFGLGIERDLHFVARHPLSVYAEAARHQGAITTIPSLLDVAAARLAARRRDRNSDPH